MIYDIELNSAAHYPVAGIVELSPLIEQAGFGAGFDVLGDDAFPGFAAAFFAGGGDAFFAQPVRGGFEIAAGFHEGFFAIHDTHAGSFPQFSNHSCINLHRN